jgi:hypothetical protein
VDRTSLLIHWLRPGRFDQLRAAFASIEIKQGEKQEEKRVQRDYCLPNLMKISIRFVTAAFCVAFAMQLPATEPASDPAETIRGFYRWYIGVVSANRTPARSEMKPFATNRLLNEIEKKSRGPDGLGADYFLDAQDFDKDWSKNISVKGVSIQGDKATATVEFRGREIARHSLQVALVRESGSWKVDKVKGRN